MELTPQEALSAVAQQQQGCALCPADVELLLARLHGTTFASIVQATPVTLAAAHKDRKIVKVTRASVQLFNNLGEFTNAYELAVKRSAAKAYGQDASAFQSQGNYFEHTACYSVVKHKARSEFYLFAIYNNAASQYVMDGAVVTKDLVASYLTPAAARELLHPQSPHNAAYNLDHNVIVRTTKLSNIVSITAMKQTAQV